MPSRRPAAPRHATPRGAGRVSGDPPAESRVRRSPPPRRAAAGGDGRVRRGEPALHAGPRLRRLSGTLPSAAAGGLSYRAHGGTAAILVDGLAVLRRICPHGILDDHAFHDGHHPALVGHVALAQAVLDALRARCRVGWRQGLAPTIDLAETARRFGIDNEKWVVVCARAATFYRDFTWTRDDAHRAPRQQRPLRGGRAGDRPWGSPLKRPEFPGSAFPRPEALDAGTPRWGMISCLKATRCVRLDLGLCSASFGEARMGSEGLFPPGKTILLSLLIRGHIQCETSSLLSIGS